MKDTPYWILKSLLEFMYVGEVNILHNKLQEILAVAENLKVRLFKTPYLLYDI